MNATMSKRNQEIGARMQWVVGLIEELRAELGRTPARRHGEAWYVDRVQSLRSYEAELRRLDALQERPE